MTKGLSERTLVIPPKKWRNAASLRGYAGQLKAEIDYAKQTDGADCVVHLKTAEALLEIVCQAIHTEQRHGL